MAWRDRLLSASFRGAEFRVESHTAEAAGRRVEVHEYPGRDRPYPEDLGRRTSQYEVEAYVLGADYDRARDALVAACAVPGPGELVHPYLGVLEVACTGCTVIERSAEGGMARITLEFVVAGEARYPAATTDTASEITAAADAAVAALEDAFVSEWDL